MKSPITLITLSSTLALLGASASANGSDITCTQDAYSLEELVECIGSHTPDEGSEGYVLPSATTQGDWRLLVQDMLAMTNIGECDEIAIPPALVGIYDVTTFHDEFNDRDYCVAIEIADANADSIVDRGWGTLIVDPAPQRHLSVDVPHPIEDSRTDLEGIGVFKGVGAHTFVLSGSNRYASSAPSSCQIGEFASDPAHSIDNLFFPAVVEIGQYHQALGHDNVSLQFHGMGSTSCPGVDIYLTHGSEDPAAPGDRIVALRDSLLALQPSWDVATPGEPGMFCDKNGTNNVEGRYLNSGDEAAVCGSDVDAYSGKFIHIEQIPDSKLVAHRSPEIWSAAIKDAFPPLTPPPASTTVSFQHDGSYAGAADTWIDMVRPTKNKGTKTECEADGDEKMTLLRWDVGAIPSGSTVQEATVTLDVTNATNSLGYYVHPLLRDWVELETTWNEYADGLPWELAGALGFFDRVSVPVGKLIPREVGTYTFTLSPSMVQQWVDDPGTNYGVLVANPNNSNGVDFYCREATTASSRPRLTVVYGD